MNTIVIILLLMTSFVHAQNFREGQLQFTRVRNAYAEKETAIKVLLQQQGAAAPFELFIRAFKKEQRVEVWVRGKGKSVFSLVVSYPFCSTSGTLGPKRKEGDLQIPEGVYHINHFNPLSNFHLSLGINYPNASDKVWADKNAPGGSIYLHGNCITIGCIPLTDDKIKELYLLAVEARANGQQKIPVHIFPARLDNGVPEQLAALQPAHLTFWKNLQTIYAQFEKEQVLKPVRITKDGWYRLSD